MADTLKRLAGPTALGTSAATVYTVPAATTATVRDVLVCNETGSAATLTISIGTDGAGKRICKDLSIPANTTWQLACGTVLAAAEVLQAYSGTASALTLTVSGVETT